MRVFLFGSILSLSLGAACGGTETASNTSANGGGSGGSTAGSGGSAAGSGGTGGSSGGANPPNTWQPVCDCDGHVRPDSCGEMDLAPAASCTTFPCGQSDCMIATQYCERQASDVGGVPDVYACKPLPASCAGATSCACVKSEACGARCGGTGSLGMVLT